MLARENERSIVAPPLPSAGGEYVELWFALARLGWTSLVVVPADPGGSTAEIAKSLAEAGKRLDEATVTAVTLSTLAPATARAIADLQRRVDGDGNRALPRGPTVEAAARILEEAGDSGPEAGSDPGGGVQLRAAPAPGRVIVSVPAVVEEPLGLALTHAASLVVVTIALGHTRLADARRTIDHIGRERVAGCILV